MSNYSTGKSYQNRMKSYRVTEEILTLQNAIETEPRAWIRADMLRLLEEMKAYLNQLHRREEQ